jgi:hypothetical protein
MIVRNAILKKIFTFKALAIESSNINHQNKTIEKTDSFIVILSFKPT